jgi:hypothetical protein
MKANDANGGQHTGRTSLAAARWRTRFLPPVVGLVVLGLMTFAATMASGDPARIDRLVAEGPYTVIPGQPTDVLARFDVPALKPGGVGSRCSMVRYPGGSPASLRVVATELSSTKSLGRYLQIGVERVRADTQRACADLESVGVLYRGPLENLPTTWAAATSTDLRGSGQTLYRLTYSLPADIPNTLQDADAGYRLVWLVHVEEVTG